MTATRTILTPAQWRQRAQDHTTRVDQVLAGHVERARAGIPHPVEDFLFTYYRPRPAELRRWSPGHGTVLQDAREFLERKWFRPVDHTADPTGAHRAGAAAGSAAVDVTVDTEAFLSDRGTTVDFVRRLVGRTAVNPAQFGCFGLHEWAMVYRQGDQRRHGSHPLRLGPDGTDAVVEQHRIRCSHFDAYRFFTPAAAPLNELRPTMEGREVNEQPGCLHAGMDLYKWSAKLLPVVPSELVLDCFVLAREIRELDMRASPYDLAALGYEPVRIETPTGRAEYVAAQREFSRRSQALRARLLDVLDAAVPG